MADIPNTKYITVKRDENGQVEIFVGWRLVVLKPATTYRGVKICEIDNVKKTFAWIQEQNSSIAELHVLSSETSGKFAKVGTPSWEHGGNAWCRVKKKDGKLGDWVFSNPSCAGLCALNCARYFQGDAAFRQAVLVTAFDNGQNGKNAQSDDLGGIDWSKHQGVNRVGLYRIIVEKVGSNAK